MVESTLQKKLNPLPAVDMHHDPAKLPSKLHLSAYVDFLAQSLCSMHSHCAACTVTVHQRLVESFLEKGLSNTTSFLGLSACQLQVVEQVFFAVVIIPQKENQIDY